MNDLEQYELNATEWWQEHGRFRPLYHLNRPRFEFFDRSISNWKSLSVLDVGCGGGYTCEFLAPRGATLTGVDLSRASVTEAAKHAERQKLTIHYQQADARSLPFPNDHFDVVVCVDVLEHIVDPQSAITEIARVLKPGGRLLFDTINRNWFTKLFFITILQDWLEIIPRDTHDYELFIKPEEMEQYLERSGLLLEQSGGLCPSGFSWKERVPLFRSVPMTCAFYLGVAIKRNRLA